MALLTASPLMVKGRVSNLRFSKPQMSPYSTQMKSSEAASGLGILTSQFSGLGVSFDKFHVRKSLFTSIKPPIKPVCSRVCPFTGKKANTKNLVSHSNHKTKKKQFVNLQYKRLWWEAGRRYVKLRLSTKALKTIEKNGLDAVAKKAGIDLRKK